MYKSGIVNNFYRELFSTEYCDTASATQNMKTDSLLEHSFDNTDESFEKWLNGLVDCYANDCDINKTALLKAISNCPEFKQDIREEFDQLLEDYEDDEDEFDEYEE
jgi:hypothetical protein